MECFRNAGKEILYEQEEFILKQYEETHRIMFHEYAEDMKDLLPPVDLTTVRNYQPGKSRICASRRAW